MNIVKYDPDYLGGVLCCRNDEDMPVQPVETDENSNTQDIEPIPGNDSENSGAAYGNDVQQNNSDEFYKESSIPEYNTNGNSSGSSVNRVNNEEDEDKPVKIRPDGTVIDESSSTDGKGIVLPAPVTKHQ